MVIRSCLILSFVVGLAGTSALAQQASGNILLRPMSDEKWTELTVRGQDLESRPPLSGGVSQFPSFTRELIRLQWRFADPVDIYLVRPRGIAKPRVVLYLYGHTSNSDRFRNEQWCKSATEGGVAAVGFVAALSGERYQGRAMAKWFVSELQEALGTTTHDVQKIIDYLQTRDDLNTDRVGMYGQGAGATVAILAASVDSRISVLDLVDPWGDWPDWLKQSAAVPNNERANYATAEFLAAVSGLDPIAVLPKLSTSRIRLQQVADNPVVPATVHDRIATALPRQAQIVRYENYGSFQQAWLQKKLWNWAKDQLQDTSSRRSSVQPEQKGTP